MFDDDDIQWTFITQQGQPHLFQLLAAITMGGLPLAVMVWGSFSDIERQACQDEMIAVTPNQGVSDQLAEMLTHVRRMQQAPWN